VCITETSAKVVVSLSVSRLVDLQYVIFAIFRVGQASGPGARARPEGEGSDALELELFVSELRPGLLD
jgi:hypothetical protein